MIINNKRQNIDLNVWHGSWRKDFNFRAFKFNIKHFFKCIKYSFQRIANGYCDKDMFNLDNYYKSLFYVTLTDLSQNCYSFPGREPFETYEKWVNYLNDMASYFYQSIEDIDYYENEYEDEFLNKFDYLHSLGQLDTKENRELRDKWLKETIEIDKLRQKDLNTALTMLKKSFNDLWD